MEITPVIFSEDYVIIIYTVDEIVVLVTDLNTTTERKLKGSFSKVTSKLFPWKYRVSKKEDTPTFKESRREGGRVSEKVPITTRPFLFDLYLQSPGKEEKGEILGQRVSFSV